MPTLLPEVTLRTRFDRLAARVKSLPVYRSAAGALGEIKGALSFGPGLATVGGGAFLNIERIDPRKTGHVLCAVRQGDGEAPQGSSRPSESDLAGYLRQGKTEVLARELKNIGEQEPAEYARLNGVLERLAGDDRSLLANYGETQAIMHHLWGEKIESLAVLAEEMGVKLDLQQAENSRQALLAGVATDDAEGGRQGRLSRMVNFWAANMGGLLRRHRVEADLEPVEISAPLEPANHPAETIRMEMAVALEAQTSSRQSRQVSMERLKLRVAEDLSELQAEPGAEKRALFADPDRMVQLVRDQQLTAERFNRLERAVIRGAYLFEWEKDFHNQEKYGKPGHVDVMCSLKVELRGGKIVSMLTGIWIGHLVPYDSCDLVLEEHEPRHDDLRALAYLPDLEELNIVQMKVSDADMIYVRSLKNLKHIKIAGPKTPNSIAWFARYSILVEVSDQGLSNLVDLPNLQKVSLIDLIDITDGAIDHLIRIKQLQEVELTGTSVTAEGRDRLQRAKPDW